MAERVYFVKGFKAGICNLVIRLIFIRVLFPYLMKRFEANVVSWYRYMSAVESQEKGNEFAYSCGRRDRAEQQK